MTKPRLMDVLNHFFYYIGLAERDEDYLGSGSLSWSMLFPSMQYEEVVLTFFPQLRRYLITSHLPEDFDLAYVENPRNYFYIPGAPLLSDALRYSQKNREAVSPQIIRYLSDGAMTMARRTYPRETNHEIAIRAYAMVKEFLNAQGVTYFFQFQLLNLPLPFSLDLRERPIWNPNHHLSDTSVVKWQLSPELTSYQIVDKGVKDFNTVGVESPNRFFIQPTKP